MASEAVLEKEPLEIRGSDLPPENEHLNDIESNKLSTTRLLQKLDLRLLPPVALLYLLSFLDRSNGLLGPVFSKIEADTL
jgi:hypothetical protein